MCGPVIPQNFISRTPENDCHGTSGRALSRTVEALGNAQTAADKFRDCLVLSSRHCNPRTLEQVSKCSDSALEIIYFTRNYKENARSGSIYQAINDLRRFARNIIDFLNKLDPLCDAQCSTAAGGAAVANPNLLGPPLTTQVLRNLFATFGEVFAALGKDSAISECVRAGRICPDKADHLCIEAAEVFGRALTNDPGDIGFLVLAADQIDRFYNNHSRIQQEPEFFIQCRKGFLWETPVRAAQPAAAPAAPAAVPPAQPPPAPPMGGEAAPSAPQGPYSSPAAATAAKPATGPDLPAQVAAELSDIPPIVQLAAQPLASSVEASQTNPTWAEEVAGSSHRPPPPQGSMATGEATASVETIEQFTARLKASSLRMYNSIYPHPGESVTGAAAAAGAAPLSSPQAMLPPTYAPTSYPGAAAVTQPVSPGRIITRNCDHQMTYLPSALPQYRDGAAPADQGFRPHAGSKPRQWRHRR